MPPTTAFCAWLFDAADQAQRATHRLSAAINFPPAMTDAAIVSWPLDRTRPLTWQVHELSDEHRLSGAFWGLLFGVLFLLPLTHDADNPEAAALEGQSSGPAIDDLARLGFDGDFIAVSRRRVVPGTSALFLLTDMASADLHRLLPPSTSQISYLPLTARQRQRLHVAFDDD